MVKKLSALLLALAFLGCAEMKAPPLRTYQPEMVQHFKGSVFKATETGYYTAELIPRPREPVVGKNDADLIIHNYKAEDLPGLQIEVTPYMPETNVVSPQKPVVDDAGRGLYVIRDLVYSEPGKWALRVKIYGPEKDSVVLPLPEVTKKAAGP
jgi:hypothetical protein